MKHSALYKMSRNTYLLVKDRENLPGWKAIEEFSGNNGSMFIHYKNEGTKEIALIFRGTDTSKLNNLVANL